MSTANYDCSELLRFRTARVLNNFYKSTKPIAQPDVRPEQREYFSGEVLVDRRQGAMPRILDGRVKVDGCCPIVLG